MVLIPRIIAEDVYANFATRILGSLDGNGSHEKYLFAISGLLIYLCCKCAAEWRAVDL